MITIDNKEIGIFVSKLILEKWVFLIRKENLIELPVELW